MQDHVQTFLSKLVSDMIKSHFFKIVLSIFCAYSMACHADYKKIIDEGFWNKVYPTGGKTFYCDAKFVKASPILTVSHIYPTGLITKQFGCRSKRSCIRSNPIYEKIISDLHNMVPVNSFYHFKLKDSIFGTLDESDKGNECGLKKRYNIIEPPERIKGDIARIHFYMHTQYDLPLNSNFLFLKSWAKNDPPSKEEIEKNKRIKEIQGNENTYISNPGLVDKLEF
ncbi:MAG: deoxyribonuclease-1 [Oleiphilaceae bacterium]|jgi:deoxyribonuclease-1